MRRWEIMMTLLALVSTGLVTTLQAQANNNHEVELLLLEAHHKASMEGNLEQAIAICQKIVTSPNGNRAIVAKALVQMGQYYEKLGRDEARKAFERVVNEFADQSDSVQVARQMLEQLDLGKMNRKGTGPNYSLALDDNIAGLKIGRFDISPAGDRIAFVTKDRMKLCLTDTSSTVTRILVDDLDNWEHFSVMPRWSPDGRMICYSLVRENNSTSSDETDRIRGIFVIDPDEGSPRQVGPDFKQRRFPVNWTDDSRFLICSSREGYHTLSLEGKEVGFVSREDSDGSQTMLSQGISPDKRWRLSKPDKDLHIQPLKGGSSRRLTNLQESSYLFNPVWAPNGESIYFVSISNGSRNIWMLPMDLNTGFATDQPRQLTHFNNTNIGTLRVLGNGDRIGFSMYKSTTSICVAESLSPQESQAVVPCIQIAPELSPDGQTLYYVSLENDEKGFYAVPTKGGSKRRLTEHVPSGDFHQWLSVFDLSPDGSAIAYQTEIDGEFGLYTVSTTGEQPRLMTKLENVKWGIVPQWSPDGSKLAYADGKGLYVLPAEGGIPREVAHLDRWEEWTVRWSPDGEFLAAFGIDENDINNAIYVVSSYGGEPRKISPDTVYKEGLEWCPDGRRLTYHLSKPSSETRIAYMDGRTNSTLIDVPEVWDYVGKWSPDRRFYYFVGWKEGGNGLYVYDQSTDKITLVSDHVDKRSVPVWSGDGKIMAWYETRSTNNQQWIMENF